MSATGRSFVQRSPTESGVSGVISKRRHGGGICPVGLSSRKQKTIRLTEVLYTLRLFGSPRKCYCLIRGSSYIYQIRTLCILCLVKFAQLHFLNCY